MSLQTRRPPGHAKRKALSYAADIATLHLQGHTYAAIREALEDAGVRVSISTVRREVLKALSKAAVPEPAAAAPSSQLSSLSSQAGLSSRAKAVSPVPMPRSMPGAAPLPGRAIAEEFMRGRPTNTLYLKECSR